MTSEPATAATHVLRSKNSSIGSPRLSAVARNHPRRAPETPRSSVMKNPTRSSPGMIALAITPARKPSGI
jgi:hypothetical protein